MATNSPFNDYSEAIVIPKKIPEHMRSHFEILRKAKKIIHILSGHAESTTLFSYNIAHGAPDPMVLPSTYHFGEFHIRFLPGWWTYIVTLDGIIQDIFIKIPHGWEEFEQDLVLIQGFIKEYKRATTPRRREVVIAFQNQLREKGRSSF
jgi:hypothetical protein